MNSVDRTFLIGARAVDLMKTYCVTAAPRSYELWYTFVTGLKPNLNRSVEVLIEKHDKLSGGDVDTLHEVHFDGERLILAAAATGGDVAHEIDQVNQLIETALETSDRYGRSLETLVSESRTVQLDRTRLDSTMGALLVATREVSETNRALANRFRRSRHEIAKLRQALDLVRQEALTDPLTGIANRRCFDAALNAARNTAVATSAPLGLVLIDIDSFKRFNDEFGHVTGDQVLRLVAQAMRDNADETATLARFGGEEFVMLLPGRTIEEARAVAERLRGNIERRELVRRSTGQSLGRVTVSVGVVTFRDGENADTLLDRADRCMYAAKNAGRNQTVSEAVTARIDAA